MDRNGDGVITPTEAMQSKDNGINEKILHEIFQVCLLNNFNNMGLNSSVVKVSKQISFCLVIIPEK